MRIDEIFSNSQKRSILFWWKILNHLSRRMLVILWLLEAQAAFKQWHDRLVALTNMIDKTHQGYKSHKSFRKCFLKLLYLQGRSVFVPYAAWEVTASIEVRSMHGIYFITPSTLFSRPVVFAFSQISITLHTVTWHANKHLSNILLTFPYTFNLPSL